MPNLGLVLRNWFCCFAVCFAISVAPVFGQDKASATRLKPELPTKAPPAPTGMTFVSSERGLERVQRGDEPRTLAELHAMEAQQSKVAAKIAEVTVNVQQGSAQGSGVIITPDGYVLTAAHVAGKPGRDVSIVLSNGTRVRGRTLGTNRTMDAGLIQIIHKSDKPWPSATLGRSTELRLGQWVIATGHPGGWMSDRPAVIRIGRVLNVLPSTLVTDCALIGGDSGGPLFDMNGQLVGIHSRIGTETADNMHVPIDVYRDGWDRLAAGEAWGSLPGFKPVIGVVGPSGTGKSGPAQIASIIEKSPAARYGLKVGDVILSFDGRTIQSFDELIKAVAECIPGDLVEVRFQREGQVMRKSLIIGVEDP